MRIRLHRNGSHDEAGAEIASASLECASGPLTVSREVIVEMVRTAALEVPGVLRVRRPTPAWLGWLAGSPVRVRVRDGRVNVRVWVIARPGHALPPLGRQVRTAVARTVERLLGMELGEVTVVIGGVGTPS